MSVACGVQENSILLGDDLKNKFPCEAPCLFRQCYKFKRQSTEAFGRISHVLFLKVDSDPEVIAFAGVFNALDHLGNPFSCLPGRLGRPVQRDTWLDQNKEVVAQCSDRKIGASFGDYGILAFDISASL